VRELQDEVASVPQGVLAEGPLSGGA
jgi:hypothetical protein